MVQYNQPISLWIYNKPKGKMKNDIMGQIR